MFDEFGGVDVRHDNRRVEGRVDLLHRRNGPWRTDPDDDPVRPHQVLDGKAFPEEFRVADHVELDRRLAVTLDRFGHLVPGPDRHRALVHHDLMAGHRRGNVTGNPLDETQVHRPVRQRRRGDGNENHVRLLHALGRAGGETQPAGRRVPPEQLFQTRLVDRNSSRLKRFDLLGVVIHANDPVAGLGKAGAGNQPHITGPDNRQFHREDKPYFLSDLVGALAGAGAAALAGALTGALAGALVGAVAVNLGVSGMGGAAAGASSGCC